MPNAETVICPSQRTLPISAEVILVIKGPRGTRKAAKTKSIQTTTMSRRFKKEKNENEIPQPPTKLLIGNMNMIDREQPMASLCAIGEEYGPLFKLQIGPKYVSLRL
jgi:glycine cleavage system pyridoxal-binding protein P